MKAELNATRIPKNRSLTDETLGNLAIDLIGCLQVWGLGVQDAYRCAAILKHKIQTYPPNTWTTEPLAGTPFKGDKVTDGGLIIADGKKISAPTPLDS